ncbi:hypothetical protein [uncultured Fibrobacter sp.]|uniref:hypothetical protein n=1 Tax=uncultured Fibrobacter sp. TaxID=261512 RepID=UPI0025D832C2|nr:hypothetical protein [uncultured Fibrobacter sp.]
MKRIAVILVLAGVMIITGCGKKNRYLNNYSGERYHKSRYCNLVNAELQYYATGETFEQQLQRYQQQGYSVIGMGENDAVVSCTQKGSDYVPFEGAKWSKERSQCSVIKLDNKNQRRVQQACQLVGGNLALYDSQKILYLRMP